MVVDDKDDYVNQYLSLLIALIKKFVNWVKVNQSSTEYHKDYLSENENLILNQLF